MLKAFLATHDDRKSQIRSQTTTFDQLKKSSATKRSPPPRPMPGPNKGRNVYGRPSRQPLKVKKFLTAKKAIHPGNVAQIDTI